MKAKKILRPTENDIPEEVLREAELMAQALFKTKPVSDGELRKKYDRKNK